MDEVPAYTRDDYLTTTKPFEYLYAHKENKFEMKQLLGRMSAQAQTVGIRNLAALFKAYMETVSGTVTPGYNKTDFSGQEMELDCGGGWSTARRVSRWFDIWPTWNSLITNKSQRFPVLAGWDGSMTMVFPLTLKT